MVHQCSTVLEVLDLPLNLPYKVKTSGHVLETLDLTVNLPYKLKSQTLPASRKDANLLWLLFHIT